MNAWLFVVSESEKGLQALHPATQVTVVTCITVLVGLFLWGMLFRD